MGKVTIPTGYKRKEIWLTSDIINRLIVDAANNKRKPKEHLEFIVNKHLCKVRS